MITRLFLLASFLAGALPLRGALLHRYTFDSGAQDSVGTSHGTLVGGAAISSGAVVLDGATGYVDLPNNLVTNLASITLETWVTDNGSSPWARIYDFGNSDAGEDFPIGSSASGTQYMFLSPRSGNGTLRGSYSISGGGAGEQVVEWSGTSLPAGVRKHVIWSSDAAAQTACLYVDGVVVASNNAVNLTPAALGPTANNWLGRSQFNDPMFLGSISEFRIYDAALTRLEIAINSAAGPDRLVTNPGTVQTVVLSVNPTMYPGGSQMASLTADFQNVTGVTLFAVPGVTYSSGDTNVISVDASGLLTARATGVAAITASYQGVSDSKSVQVLAQPQTLVHRYSFTSDVSDSVGGADGTLQGGATITDGAVQFNGSSAYVDLPNDLVSDLTSVTFEVWYTDAGSSTWARIWDIGNSVNGEDRQGGGVSYTFFCVPSGSGGIRGAYKLTGQSEQLLDYGTRPSLNTQHHVAWTQDGLLQSASLYVDGILVGHNAAFSYTPAAIGPTVNDWLGRSQYNDPYFKGSINEFRIYSAALSADEVQQDFALGPDTSPQGGPVAITTQPAAVTVPEQEPANFTFSYIGQRPISMQWYRNNVVIPGATNPIYQLAMPLPPDSGALFSVRLTNTVNNQKYTATSTSAALTVIPDTTRPTLVRALSVGVTNVQISFSERVEIASATNKANYVFSNGQPINAASLPGDGLTVTLTTSALVYGSNYTVRVTNVRDRAYTPNSILANSPVSFIASPYNPVDIGGSLPTGTLTGVPGGFDVTAGGGAVGGTADQCSFNYQAISGDFDIQVRVQNLTAVSSATEAGLMARESLDAGSRFAAALATPQLKGSYFEYRAALSGTAVAKGAFPPNLPNAWLRLQRVGPVLNGYASYDGQAWVLLGSANLAFPSTVYVGLVVASGVNGSPATAQFRDLGQTLSAASGAIDTTVEALGPCSRRTPIAISEIMYKPVARADGRNLEFIEIFNSNPWPEDIGRWRLGGDIKFTFPAGYSIPGGGFVVIAAQPADLQAVYGLANVLGPYTNSLTANGHLTLRDEADALLLEVNYKDESPWPAAASGAGHSLVLARPSYGEADPRAWDISDVVGGSPGLGDNFRPSPLRNVMLNEILAHTDAPDTDTIELYNHANAAVDLAGCVLTDNAATNKYVFPQGSSIPARGFIYLTEPELGFALNAAGETIYFKNPQGTRVLDALSFGAQQNGISFGRYPDGAGEWYRQSTRTFGAANAAPRVDQVLINELMYHPISGVDDDQYIELYNRGVSSVNLRGWRLGGGINFVFPNLTLPGNAYVVVGANVARLRSNYPQLNATNSLGNFSGRLSGAGERITLSTPDTIISTNNLGIVVTNNIDIVVDEVTYRTGGRWGQWSDGGGSSLELIDPRADKRLAANWADSDETAKASWVNIEASGVLDNGSNYDPNIGYAQIGLLELGECLIDNVEVRSGSVGANVVSNPGFDQGLTGWSLQGNHSRSSLDSGGGYPPGGPALHVRASGAIFTGANSAQVALSDTSLASGQTATLRFKARWLKGTPEVMMRLNGNWLEAVGRLSVPANLGTPGLPNSRATSNAAPAVYAVAHSPSIPASMQAVLVTARVSDPDGVASLKLRYRIDPSTAYTEVAMQDSGASGDAIAGDGIWSGTIPGQAAGTVVAFVLAATDTRAAATRFPALLDNNAPDRECVVVFGDPNPASVFGAYHLWLTQTNVNRWVSLPVVSNEEVDATLVSGSRVIYNASSRYAGSPYHQAFNSPYGNACHYHWSVPKDDRFLGASSLNKIHWPGNDIQDDTSTQNNNDPTIQRGQAANYFLRALGVPWVNRRYVAVYVNGWRRGTLMEDAQRPSISVGEEYFPGDPGGILYKVQPWFEFGPAPSGNYMPWQNKAWATILPYKTTGGTYKTARYRWIWQMREAPDSLNNYTNLFTLIDAVSSSGQPGYTGAMQKIADMENWMRLVAANHAVGNWDCLGVQNGQNVYAYVSPQVPWTFFMFDMDIVLGNRIAWGPGANLNGFYGSDANWTAIYANPTFNRIYWRALKELANGLMAASNFDPRVDAKYASIRGDGFPVQDPAPIKTWVAQARASILSQVASRDATGFTLSSTDLTASANSVTLGGAAPLEVAAILVNGRAWNPTWSSLTGWTLNVPVPAGISNWSVQAVDRFGNAVGSPITINITNAAAPESPVGNVVFNEIMFTPTVDGAQFVELYNRSLTTTFDLSGWEINGLSYTFPPGSSLAPGSYLVLAGSSTAFAATYGALTPLWDVYNGNLQADGETLSLIIPGVPPAADLVVDRVRYEPTAPWPTAAAQAGRSLQLIDPMQDNSRVGDWSVGPATPQPPSPQWVYRTVTGPANTSRLYVYLGSAGDIFLDDMKIVAGSVPEAGPNLLANGDFESSLSGTWNFSTDFSQSALSTSVRHSGNSSLHLVATAAGSGANDSMYKDISPALTTNATYTLSFWYRQNTNGTPLIIRLSGATSGSGIYVSLNPAVPSTTSGPATPGTVNAVSASLPSFPTLWLNEVQPQNISGLPDSYAERDPWVEIYNPGTASQGLSGLYLGTNYNTPLLWAFPGTASVAPGQYLTVWCDGQPGQTTASELHTSFRLNPGSGSIMLSRMVGTNLQCIDYLNYSGLQANYSYGDVPDGQPFYRRSMFNATPGNTNNAAGAPITVFINEWMADNTGYMIDPGTGKYDDWFELYNPTDTAADLSGYYLTDSLTNQFQYQIPSGYLVPAHGYLLVWADSKTSANTNTSPDLHTPFKLDKDGEAIGLFSLNGLVIDAVEFQGQAENVSEGRYPNGGPLRLSMPAPSPRAPNVLPPSYEPPSVSSFEILPGSQCALTFVTSPGHTYRVEFKNDLNAGGWTPLGGDIFAVGNQYTITDPISGIGQRYYRILQVE